MRGTKLRLSLFVGIFALIVGCGDGGSSKAPFDPSELDDLFASGKADRITDLVEFQGAIRLGDPKVDELIEDRYVGYFFLGDEDQTIDLAVDALDSGSDPVLLVYGPETSSGKRERLAKNDDGVGRHPRIAGLTLDERGDYLLVVGEFARGPGRFELRVDSKQPDPDPDPDPDPELETIRVEVEGFVAGSESGSRGPAHDSWKAACDAWVEQQRTLTAGTPVAYECGEARDVNGSSFYYHFVSNPTISITLQVPEGTGDLEPTTVIEVSGKTAGDRTQSYASWARACTDQLEQLEDLYPERLLAATCVEPDDKDGSSFYWRQVSALKAWLAPAASATLEIPGYISGVTAGEADTGHISWQEACWSWIEQMAELSPAASLVSHGCGSPADADGSSFYYRYTSEPLLTIALPGEGRPEEKKLTEVIGQERGSVDDAMSSWRSDCVEALREFKTDPIFGTRYLAGSCGTPRDINGSSFYYEFASTPTVWLTAVP